MDACICRMSKLFFPKADVTVVTHEVNVVFLSALAWSKYIHKYFHIVFVQKATEFGEITQSYGYYAVQSHSRSPTLVPIESSYTTSYYWLIVTYLLSCTVSKLWSIFRWREGSDSLNALARGDPLAVSDISLKSWFFGLHFRRWKYHRIFNHFYVIRPESYRIRWNYAAVSAITPFKVIQGHRVWYRSKSNMRLPISH